MPLINFNTCDYCEENAVCKITIHNKYWNLCLVCAKKHKKRLMIKDEELIKLEKELENAK